MGIECKECIFVIHIVRFTKNIEISSSSRLGLAVHIANLVLLILRYECVVDGMSGCMRC